MNTDKKSKQELKAELLAARDRIRQLESRLDTSTVRTPSSPTSFNALPPSWLEDALHVAKVGTFCFDLTSGERIWSKGLSRVYGEEFGHPPEKLEDFQQLVHPADWPDIKKAVLHLLETRESFVHVIRISKNGEEYFVEVSAKVLCDQNDTVVKIVGVIQDVTQSTRLQQQLQENEEKMRTLYENVSIGLYRTSPDGKILLQNPALRKILGFKSEEAMKGRDLSNPKFYHPDYSREEFKKKLEAEGEIKGLESAWRHENGKTIYVRENAHCVYDEDGNILYYEGTAEDITEHKLAQQSLEESESRYRLITDNVLDVVWQMEADGRFSYVSPSIKRMMGYSVEEGLNISIIDTMTEESALLTRRNIAALTPERPDATQETELIHKDGYIIPAEIRATSFFDHNGNLKYIIGVTRDTSERKAYEEKIRDSEKKYRDLIAHTAEGVVMADENGIIFEWNTAQERITGIPYHEVIGKPVWEMHAMLNTPGSQRMPTEIIHKRILRSLKTGEADWDREALKLHIVHPDGTHRYIEQRSYLIKTDAGFRIGTIAREITEQVLVEEQLEKERRFILDTIDTDPNLIFVKNAGGRIMMANKAFANLFNQTPRQIIGQHISDLFTDQARLEQEDEIYDKVYHSGQTTTLEESYVVEPGTIQWYQTTKTPILLQLGQRGILSVSVDITEQKRNREALERKDAILEAVSFTTTCFLRHGAFDACVGDVLENMGKATNASQVHIVRMTDPLLTGHMSEIVHVWSHPELSESDLFDSAIMEKNAEHFMDWIGRLSSGKAIHGAISDFPGEQRKILETTRAKSLAIVPVFKANEWWGFISFVTIHNEYIWSAPELDALKASAAAIGAALLRDQVASELQQSEQKYRTLAANIPGSAAFLFNHDFEILLAEGPGIEVAGFDKTTLQNQNIQDILPDDILERVFPLCEEALLGNQKVLEGSIQSKDYMLVSSPLYGRDKDIYGGIIFVQDVTDLKEAQRALHQSEREKTAILDSLSELVALYNPDMEILWANRAAADSVDVSVEDLGGKHCYEMWYHTEKPCTDCPVAKSFRTGAIETSEVTTSENRIWFLTAYPLKDTRGVVKNVVEVAMEITDQRRAQQEALERNRLEATATLAGGVAHDINNLMVGVMGNAELLRMDLRGSSEDTELLVEIVESAERAGILAQEMLAFSRQGKYMLNNVNVNNVVENVYRSLAKATSNDIRFDLELDPKLHEIIADSSQIHMAFMHIIRNSIEAISSAGTITLSTTNQSFSSSDLVDTIDVDPGSYVHLTVMDDGCGMPPEVLKRIFEPMFSTKFAGRGMGMAAVYGIIRNHDGDITIASKPGEGTRVDVYLPENPKIRKRKSDL